MGDDHHPHRRTYTTHNVGDTKARRERGYSRAQDRPLHQQPHRKDRDRLRGWVLLSAILFRRRAWPVWLFTGVGIGSGYSDANRIFNPAAILGYKIAEKPAKA